jgi:hypothetical protein
LSAISFDKWVKRISTTGSAKECDNRMTPAKLAGHAGTR